MASTPTQGYPDRCPHCGNVAGTERARLLRYRCRVCGGPRVVVTDPHLAPSLAAEAPLGRAQRARFRRAVWSLVSLVIGGFGLLGLLVAVVVWTLAQPGVAGTLALLAMVGTPLGLAVAAMAKARESRRELEAELDLAWLTVAGELVGQQEEPVAPRRLGELMGTGEHEAERLLAKLNTTDMVHSEVTDAGEVVYSGRSHYPKGLRVEEEAVAAEEGEAEEGEAGKEEAEAESAGRPRAGRTGGQTEL